MDKDKELIELAKEALKKSKVKFVDYKVEEILKTLNIKPGTTKVPASILYYMYTKAYNSPIKPKKFFQHLRSNFESKVIKNETYYFVEGTGIDLSFKNIFQARQLLAKHYGKKAKTKKNK